MHRFERLHMTIEHLQDSVGYVLLVARGDGKVLLLGTCNARNRLAVIAAASPLEHFVEAFRTDHYHDVVHDVKTRFTQWSEDGLGVWFHVDAEEMRRALDEYDLARGVRVRMEDLTLGDRVWVKDFGGGRIKAFGTTRASVELDNPKGAVKILLVPRSLLKPYLRAAS